QENQRPGGRHGGARPVQQRQQPMPLMPQQRLPRGGRMYQYSPRHHMTEFQMLGVAGDAVPQPIPNGALVTALVNASPDQQITMPGEVLYPLVDELLNEMKAKVLGMLLEMDQTALCTFWNLLK
ncbi:hypothetical protein MKX01_037162, partial [Papaver californicum]